MCIYRLNYPISLFSLTKYNYSGGTQSREDSSTVQTKVSHTTCWKKRSSSLSQFFLVKFHFLKSLYHNIHVKKPLPSPYFLLVSSLTRKITSPTLGLLMHVPIPDMTNAKPIPIWYRGRMWSQWRFAAGAFAHQKIKNK